VNRFCSEPGCTKLAVNSRWCTDHENNNRVIRAAKAKREQPTEKWYSLRIWRDRLRPMKLRHDPLCQDCGRAVATQVHHIRGEWKNGGPGAWSMFVDFENMQSLCASCHSKITMAENHQQGALS
jgi:hypothetical protein